jgi:hypothetical protein
MGERHGLALPSAYIPGLLGQGPVEKADARVELFDQELGETEISKGYGKEGKARIDIENGRELRDRCRRLAVEGKGAAEKMIGEGGARVKSEGQLFFLYRLPIGTAVPERGYAEECMCEPIALAEADRRLRCGQRVDQ